ncbi:hypothetical protein [Pelagerythrobacter marensis]|nr:hypothetical protein [Pelagerythrobacter marensis]
MIEKRAAQQSEQSKQLEASNAEVKELLGSRLPARTEVTSSQHRRG